MKEEKKESPIGILWGWGKPYHGKFIGSIALAVLGVACQMVPYFCVAHIVTLMLSGDQNFSHYTAACVIALCGYLGKVIFSNLSTTISHTATYYTLRDLRENITEKLARVPMGTILDTPSGQYKTTIVDRVEGMEPTFAHLIPEMTANVLVPLVIVVYLFVMDWRMALLSLVTLVVGLAVMSAGMKNYPVKWEGAVKAGKLPDGALFLCSSYCYADVVRGSEFFALYSSLCYCALRLFGKSHILKSFHNNFSHSDLLHAARSPGEYYRKTGPRPDGDDFRYSVRSV